MDIHSFLMKPTLKQLASAQVVIDLWLADDIRNSMEAYPFPSDHNEGRRLWTEIEKQVEEDVWAFPLPKSLRLLLLKYVFQIGYQIKCWWKKFHFEYKCIDQMPARLYWSPLGILNRAETAKKVFVEDESRDLNFRYKLACVYCLKEEVLSLWGQLPRAFQKNFYYLPDKEKHLPAGHQEWIEFWTTYIESQGYARVAPEPRCEFHFLDTFNHSVKHGKLAPTRFLFERLTAPEVDKALTTCWRRWRAIYARGDVNVIFYLLARMNAERRAKALNECCFCLLQHALRWSWHAFFLRLARECYGYLTRGDFRLLVRSAINAIIRRSFDHEDYRLFFLDFWQQSPPHLRLFVLDDDFPWLATHLCKRSEMEIAAVVFNEVDAVQKHSLIFDELGSALCKEFIVRKQWDYLRFIIDACIPSKDILVEYKLFYEKKMKNRYYRGLINEGYQFEKFFQIIDDIAEDKD